MTRLPVPNPNAEQPESVQAIFTGLQGALGAVPNVARMMATSPTVLSAVVGFQMALSGVLDPETRNAIALAVSQVDDCTYCRNLHAYNAVKFTQAEPAEIALNLEGSSSNARRAAAATFGALVVSSNGHVSDDELAAVKDAGFSDAEVLEIIAWSMSVLATNFINNVAGTDVDLTPELARAGQTES